MERLVNESAAAKQIIEGNDEEAKALREKSILHLKEAVSAQEQGNAEAVTEALSSAKKAIFSAMRLIGGKVVKDKNLIVVKGAVPGHTNSYVIIQK